MERYYGILTRIDWNSNRWQSKPTPEDLATSEYNKDNSSLYAAFNFAVPTVTSEENTVKAGYFYQFSESPPKPEALKYLKVVFVQSRDLQEKKEMLVGLYAFPTFAVMRDASPYEELPYIYSNLKTTPAFVHLFENFLDMDTLDKKLFSVQYKSKGKRTYSWLSQTQVGKILDSLTIINPQDKQLHALKFKLLKSMM